jgi:hypothetical protein
MEDITMKLRKIMAGIIATSVAGTMAVAASAQYDAFLMYADADWYPSIMDATGHTEGSDGTVTEWTAGTAEVTKDGTYTVSVADIKASSVDEETGEETMAPALAEGAVVFNVDIADLGTALGFGKDCEGYDKNMSAAEKMELAKSKGVNVTDVKITQVKDGETTEVAVDSSKIFFGDIEGNGKLRIELYNEYGDTKADAPLKVSDIYFNEGLNVTFTISGIDAILNGGNTTPDETEAPATDAPTTGDSSKPNSNTGVEGVAAVAGVAVVAAGAVIVAKKRK